MCPKKQQRVTKQKQDKMLERFYAEFEIETDKTVVLGEFTEDNDEVEFTCVVNNLSKDEEYDIAETSNGADDKPWVAEDTSNIYKEPAGEQVSPANNTIPILPNKQKFKSLTDTLKELKNVDFASQRHKDLHVHRCQENNGHQMKDSNN